MNIRTLALLGTVLLTVMLGACQSTPPSGLNPAQIATLKARGFTLNDDNWVFDLSGKVLFDTNSEDISKDSQALLANLTRSLLEVDLRELTLEGHTDNQGSEAYNEQLSLRRAETVAQVMQSHGMPKDGITLRGMGAKHPIGDNSTETGRGENRRVSIIIEAQ